MNPDETINLKLIGKQGHTSLVELCLWDAAPEDATQVKLLLRHDSVQFEQVGDNYFDAMVRIRRELEKKHLLLHCYGASKHVYPSPMALDMGSGHMAYRLALGRKARIKDLVSIFETGPDVNSVTVDEQEKFYQTWLASF